MKNPDECAICFDLPLQEKDILSCGHRVHISCVQKQFKAECPFCRAPLNIEVFGKNPISVFGPDDEEEVKGEVMGVPIFLSIRRGILGNVIERNVEDLDLRHNDEEDEEIWRAKGYQYAEEDSDYDEENPHGDSWEYEHI